MENRNEPEISNMISILMGIYNCEKTLGKAIESILAQTYAKWELIMCDDGSTDNTYKRAEEYAERYPDKIFLIKNEKNQGLNITLNNCLKIARGEFIARQDADDWSLPNRLEKEINYLWAKPDCAFVSAGMIVNNGYERIGVRLQKEVRPKKEGFMHSNQFYHAPCMIRREAILKVGGYSEDVKLLRVEDFNLWTKLYAAGYYGENIMEGLYEVCEDDATYGRRKFRYRVNGAYAKMLAIKMLELPKYYYIYPVQGMLKGLVPRFIYKYMHAQKVKKSTRGLDYRI